MHKIDGQGAVDGQFVAENTSSGQQPTVVTPEWLNAVQGEIAGVLAAAGITPVKSDNSQLAQSIRALIEARVGDYVTSTNAGNAYTVALDPPVTSYTGKTAFAFKAGATNTGAVTLNAGGGVAALLREDGSAMQAGDIGAGAILTVVYDTASGAFRATEIVASQVQTAIAAYAPSKIGVGAYGLWDIGVHWGNVYERPIFATVATSGSYADLTDKPSIPAVPAKVSSFMNDAGYLTSVSWVQVSGKPDFATVATSGSYADLIDKPSIPAVPAKVSSFVNDAGYLTSGLGIGQTWVDMTASRTLGATYTNSTGRPIVVNVAAAWPSGYNVSVTVTATVGLVSFMIAGDNSDEYCRTSGSFIVPTGATYSVSMSSTSIGAWHELR